MRRQQDAYGAPGDVIRLDGVTKAYQAGAPPALADVSLSVANGEVAAIINEECFDSLDAPIVRIASFDSPVPFSPPLEEVFLPRVEDVVREARRLKRY